MPLENDPKDQSYGALLAIIPQLRCVAASAGALIKPCHIQRKGRVCKMKQKHVHGRLMHSQHQVLTHGMGGKGNWLTSATIW